MLGVACICFFNVHASAYLFDLKQRRIVDSIISSDVRVSSMELGCREYRTYMVIWLIVGVFVAGYAAIALEHSIGLNKAGSALATGVICWANRLVFSGDSTLGRELFQLVSAPPVLTLSPALAVYTEGQQAKSIALDATVVIGTVASGAGVGTQPFVVQFNTSARPSSVTELLKALRFGTLNSTSNQLRSISLSFNDGDGGIEQGLVRVTVRT
jgi:hypothetical protein